MGTDCLAPFSSPALLLEPQTLITSGSHRPCLVPIISLPATISGSPKPYPHPTPTLPPPSVGTAPSPLQPSASPAQWGPQQPVSLPLTPTKNVKGHLTAPQMCPWLCLLPGVPRVLVATTHILLGLAQTSKNPTIPSAWSPHLLGKVFLCQALCWAHPLAAPGRSLVRVGKRRGVYLEGVSLQRKKS